MAIIGYSNESLYNLLQKDAKDASLFDLPKSSWPVTSRDHPLLYYHYCLGCRLDHHPLPQAVIASFVSVALLVLDCFVEFEMLNFVLCKCYQRNK